MKIHATTLWASLFAGFVLNAAVPAMAAGTDLASTPVFSATTSTVKPNLFFILDDSGSMKNSYMPDGVSANQTKYCYENASYNRIYFNPNITYSPPVDSTGTAYADSKFTAAYVNGYDTSAGTVNLNTSFQAYTGDNSDTAQQAYYYEYTGTSPSTAVTGTCYSDSKYTKHKIASGDAAAQNFANWYTYYRTRILMMKTAMSLAFKDINSSYRVGFMTINNNNTNDFLNIADFDSTQKKAWYDKLFLASTASKTPLRSALSTGGLLYAGILNGKTLNGSTVADPVQYSCQQNITILSTDGYWNTGNDSGCSGRSGAGCKLDQTSAVGNQDNNSSTAPRPYYDGNLSGATDTLADVALYYYKTDLRDASLGTDKNTNGDDVSKNNVPTNGSDSASWQHMSTFTISLGVAGNMTYSSTYETDTSGDYYNIKNGTVTNGSGSPCSWSGSKQPCDWPVPDSQNDSLANGDDVWHAAVNGRGLYVAANDPSDVKTGLDNILNRITAQVGSAAAATTSNPNVSSGDNFVFSSTYTTSEWWGELTRRQIDTTTGALSTVIDWVVSDCTAPSGYTFATGACNNLLDNVTYTARKIYTFSTSAANHLRDFAWANLSSSEQSLLGSSGVVEYVRGSRTGEGTTYRTRKHVLGDIVSSEATYVKKPPYSYSDVGYTDFQTANASRQGVVYVGANDGMLHAFNADNGAELWAYVPTHVFPNLANYASTSYGHQFYVDGTPVTGDACKTTLNSTTSLYECGSKNDWRTIIVGTLNNGGKGVYALDVTNPTTPVGLWEFTSDTSKTGYISDANLGYTYGNPIITKLANGRWVVLITSGYNNHTGGGDGQGWLYVLDAFTGAILDKKTTGAGDTTTPSGLARISAWADKPTIDNTALQVYGGDLFGNLWRFDLTSGSLTVLKLAILTDPSDAVQPITGRPELGNVSGSHVVYVGTGQLLGSSDLSTTQVQSFYAIKDGGASRGKIRGGTGVSKYTISTVTDAVTGTQYRKVACDTGCTVADFSGSSTAWFFDLPDSKERVSTDPTLALGTIIFTTNIPDSTACFSGGSSWIYYLDYSDGQPVSGDYVGQRLGNALATAPEVVELPNGSVETLTQLSDGKTIKTDIPVSASGATRRVFWREIFSQ